MNATIDEIQPRASCDAFQTTHWSVVRAAGVGTATASQQALEELCRVYWFPLYAFVRRQGDSPEDAEDLTQEFFARFLERGYFALANRERGRFRTFLLTSLKRFKTEEWRRSRRLKRGGGITVLPLDTDDAELRYASEPRHELTPDRLFDRRWAETLLERVLVRLRRDYESTGRAEIYRQLQQFMWGCHGELSYAEMGLKLGINEGAVKVAVFRLRQRYRDLLRDEVAQTVDSPDQVEGELRHLLQAFTA